MVDVVDTRTNKITGTRKIAEIGGLLTRLTLSGDGDRAYLVSDDRVTMLCTLTQDVIGTVNVATQPSCVVESPDGKYLYIADYSGTVTVAPIASSSRFGYRAGGAGKQACPSDLVHARAAAARAGLRPGAGLDRALVRALSEPRFSCRGAAIAFARSGHEAVLRRDP